MNLTRIARQAKEVKVADELRGVDPAAVTGVDVALVVPRTAPDALTVWTPADYLNGVATILLAGPDASPVGALVVPGDVDLWVRALAGDEVLVGKVERITVEGGGAVPPSVSGSYVVRPTGGTDGQVLGLDGDVIDWLDQTGSGGGAVASVNGQTGAVVLDAPDVGAQPAGDYATTADLATGLASKVNSSTYTAGLAGKADAADLAAKAPYRAGVFAPPTAPLRVVSAMETGWTHLDQGTSAHDTTVFDTGAASLKITAPGLAGGGKSTAWLPFAAQDWSTSAFSFRFRTDDWASIIDGYLLASTSGVLAQFFRLQITAKMARVVNNEWSEVTFTRGDFDFNSGTANWATVNGLAFQLYSATGTTPSLWIDQFLRYPVPARPTISFAFDDGFASTFTVAKPAMDAYGFRGSAYVMPTALNTAGYMTQAQVDALAQQGWEIGGHNVTDLTTLSLAAAEADVAATKAYLVDRGYKGGDVYAYPLGGQNFALRAMVAKYFGAARGTSPFGQTRALVNRRNMMTRQFGPAITVATVQAWIDQAVAGNEWLILTGHALRTPTSTAEDYTPANFAAVVDAVAASGVQVLPVAEALADPDAPPIFRAPNGAQYRLGVDNTGALVTSPL